MVESHKDTKIIPTELEQADGYDVFNSVSQSFPNFQTSHNLSVSSQLSRKWIKQPTASRELFRAELTAELGTDQADHDTIKLKVSHPDRKQSSN